MKDARFSGEEFPTVNETSLMPKHRLEHVPDDQIIDLSSDEEIARLTRSKAGSGKPLNRAMIKRMIGKAEVLLGYIPGAPSFMKGIHFDGFASKEGRFSLKRKSEKKLSTAIEETRGAINSYIEDRTLDPRKLVKKHLDRFHESADMHALHAIYLFNSSVDYTQNAEVSEVASNRLDEDRLKRLRRSLLEMMSAFFNDCISVYYATWFVQIYNEYLITLARILKFNYVVISEARDARFEEMERKVHRGQLQVEAMILKKEELEPFHAMCRMVANTSFVVFSLTRKQIRDTLAILEKNPDRQLSVTLNVNNVMTMVMSILNLFARVPVFTEKKLVLNTLRAIPKIGEEMEMRKRVIMSTQYVSDYRMAVALGDLNLQRSAMRTVLQYCVDTIENHMDGTVPTRWHANIIMRISWVVVNASDQVIFDKNEFENLLREAYRYLGYIVNNCTIKTNPKHKENGSDLRQQLIDKAILSRNKLIEIGKINGIHLDQ